MPEFISKLQHKTYEKGEFSDEKIRSLDDTLEIIKKFPWDAERTLTDIQLTGPSVTIRDEDMNCLKVGLYFGGKFCLYYLANDNHLYEFHAQNMDEALDVAKSFFNGSLDLENFEKHLFNIGNQPHFVTNTFEYKIKAWRILLLIIYFIFYIVSIAGSAIGSKQNNIIIFPGIFIAVLGAFILYILFKAFINRNLYLQISRGNNKFSFGDNGHIVVYDKLDIESISYYQRSRGVNSRIPNEAEIKFKNGEILLIPNMLISQLDFLSKFPEQLKIPIIYQRRTIFGGSKYISNS